jgi:hypothetical protein
MNTHCMPDSSRLFEIRILKYKSLQKLTQVDLTNESMDKTDTLDFAPGRILA